MRGELCLAYDGQQKQFLKIAWREGLQGILGGLVVLYNGE